MKKSTIALLSAFFSGLIAFSLMAAPCCVLYSEGDTGNVFDYAFGTSTLRQEGGFLAIFIPLLIGVIFLGISLLIRGNSASKSYSAFVALAAITFMIGGIAFFNVRNIMADFAASVNRNYTSDEYKSVLSLKAGPILGGILSLLAFGLCIVFEVLENKEGATPKPEKEEAPAPVLPATLQSENEEDERIAMLKTYHDLLESGAITSEEYEAKKKEILK